MGKLVSNFGYLWVHMKTLTILTSSYLDSGEFEEEDDDEVEVD